MHPNLEKILSTDDLVQADFDKLFEIEDFPELSIHSKNVIWRKYDAYVKNRAKILRKYRKQGEKLFKDLPRLLFQPPPPPVRRSSAAPVAAQPEITLGDPSIPVPRSTAENVPPITLPDNPTEAIPEAAPGPQIDIEGYFGEAPELSNFLLTGEKEWLSLQQNQQVGQDSVPLPIDVSQQQPETHSSSRVSQPDRAGSDTLSTLQRDLAQWILAPLNPRPRQGKRKRSTRPLKLIKYASYYAPPANLDEWNCAEPFIRPAIHPFLMEQLLAHPWEIEREGQKEVQPVVIEPPQQQVEDPVPNPPAPMEIEVLPIAMEQSIPLSPIPPHIPSLDWSVDKPAADEKNSGPTLKQPAAELEAVPIEGVSNPVEQSTPLSALQGIPSAEKPNNSGPTLITPLATRQTKYSTPVGLLTSASIGEVSQIRDISSIQIPIDQFAAEDPSIQRTLLLQGSRSLFANFNAEKIAFIRDSVRELSERIKIPIEELVTLNDTRLVRAWKLGLLTELDNQLWRLEIDAMNKLRHVSKLDGLQF